MNVNEIKIESTQIETQITPTSFDLSHPINKLQNEAKYRFDFVFKFPIENTSFIEKFIKAKFSTDKTNKESSLETTYKDFELLEALEDVLNLKALLAEEKKCNYFGRLIRYPDTSPSTEIYLRLTLCLNRRISINKLVSLIFENMPVREKSNSNPAVMQQNSTLEKLGLTILSKTFLKNKDDLTTLEFLNQTTGLPVGYLKKGINIDLS